LNYIERRREREGVKGFQEEKNKARYDLKEKIRCREALSVKSFAT
jgi:hypothetical protein